MDAIEYAVASMDLRRREVMEGPFDFIAALRSDGTREHKYDGGIMEDDRFYYRFLDNDVHVAIKATFDRWANSTDFTFPRPKTARAYLKTMRRLERDYQARIHDVRRERISSRSRPAKPQRRNHQ